MNRVGLRFMRSLLPQKELLMSNIVPLGLPKRPNLAQRQGALIRSFACHRRGNNDVLWLKENAEVLNVLASGAGRISAQYLDVYAAFYDSIEERLQFFPQYYRFLLSICLDLEDLGLEGNKGLALCRTIEASALAACELSDLQRAEVQRLLARRGFGGDPQDLNLRLHAFMAHTDTFALPNKKAAYELTHIVFYLSEYGAKTLDLSKAALTSLEYAGLLAFLDQDLDLLSEVCVAMRFAGQIPSDIWEGWLEVELGRFVLEPAPDGPAHDAYHEYLVSSWWADVAGRVGFRGSSAESGCISIARVNARKGPLRAMSEVMYRLGPARSGNWGEMRRVLERSVADEQRHILNDAYHSSPNFDGFFRNFARV